MRLYYLEEKMSSMDWEYHGIPQGILFFCEESVESFGDMDGTL
jgi:hypothetical protein